MQEHSRWVGRVLRDKWRIDARIARGGVGTVFAATHKNNGHRVAIKVLHPQFSRDQDTRSRFLQEGYAANQVSHPGVVRILDDDMLEDGSAFLVMELLEGELLEKRRLRKGGKLPLGEVFDLAEQLLDVLVAAHEKGIVHRDIKPDNLFITNGNRLKVLDFGFAQMKTGFRRETTATGFLLGTPGFMSPEQAVGNRAKVDGQTDIWAVGATLFTLLSGKPVHDAESAVEMLVAAANYACRSLASLEPGLPMPVVEIVDRSLAFEKNDRWPTAKAMQLALRSVPGRPTNEGMFESGRRSVSAMSEHAELTREEVLDEIEPMDVIESGEWSNEDQTVLSTSEPRHESSRPPIPNPTNESALDPQDDQGTLVMEGRHGLAPNLVMRRPAYERSTGYSDTAPAYPHQLQAIQAMQAMQTGPYLVPPPDLQRSLQQPPTSMALRLVPLRAPILAPKSRVNRVLLFAGVVIVTMAIVVLTGLLVFAAGE